MYTYQDDRKPLSRPSRALSKGQENANLYQLQPTIPPQEPTEPNANLNRRHRNRAPSTITLK